MDALAISSSRFSSSSKLTSVSSGSSSSNGTAVISSSSSESGSSISSSSGSSTSAFLLSALSSPLTIEVASSERRAFFISSSNTLLSSVSIWSILFLSSSSGVSTGTESGNVPSSSRESIVVISIVFLNFLSSLAKARWVPLSISLKLKWNHPDVPSKMIHVYSDRFSFRIVKFFLSAKYIILNGL